jgi:phage major head subunit gpT-like protein
MGYRVSKEMMLEDAVGIIPQLPKALAYAARQTIETKVWNLFNLGFTAGVNGADGVTLFNASHPLKGSSTLFSNTATAASLTATALQNAIVNAFDTLVDDRGLPVIRTAKYLVVPPQLEKTALEIIKSAYVPGSANNEVNIQYDRLQVVVSRYITSTTAWFVLGDKGPLGSDAHSLKVIWRWKDNFEQDKDFNSKTIKNSLDLRFTYGWTDWRATYGNQGL